MLLRVPFEDQLLCYRDDITQIFDRVQCVKKAFRLQALDIGLAQNRSVRISDRQALRLNQPWCL